MPGPGRGQRKVMKAGKRAMKAALRRSVRANIRQTASMTPEQTEAAKAQFSAALNAAPNKDQLIKTFSSPKFQKMAKRQAKGVQNAPINAKRREWNKAHPGKQRAPMLPTYKGNSGYGATVAKGMSRKRWGTRAERMESNEDKAATRKRRLADDGRPKAYGRAKAAEEKFKYKKERAEAYAKYGNKGMSRNVNAKKVERRYLKAQQRHAESGYSDASAAAVDRLKRKKERAEAQLKYRQTWKQRTR